MMEGGRDIHGQVPYGIPSSNVRVGCRSTAPDGYTYLYTCAHMYEASLTQRLRHFAISRTQQLRCFANSRTQQLRCFAIPHTQRLRRIANRKRLLRHGIATSLAQTLFSASNARLMPGRNRPRLRVPLLILLCSALLRLGSGP